jgi:hypothetical protein
MRVSGFVQQAASKAPRVNTVARRVPLLSNPGVIENVMARAPGRSNQRQYLVVTRRSATISNSPIFLRPCPQLLSERSDARRRSRAMGWSPKTARSTLSNSCVVTNLHDGVYG